MTNSAENVTLTAVITGRVQGVGYRQFVWYHATRLHVAGWVRNQADGSVEVVASGQQAVIATLLELLRQGPPPARVATVGAEWLPRTGIPDGFEMR